VPSDINNINPHPEAREAQLTTLTLTQGPGRHITDINPHPGARKGVYY